MIDFTLPNKLYLMPGYSSIRQSRTITSGLIQMSTVFNPSETAAYLFCNSRKDVLRILYWDGEFFMDIHYPLISGTFKWPLTESKFMEISLYQLERLLQGDTLTPRIQSPKIIIG